MARTVTLVVVDAVGTPLGTLPPFDVAVPYWQEVADIGDAASTRFGVDVTILRVLAGTPGPGPVPTRDGSVTYLAQAAALPAAYAGPVTVDLAPHPLRAPYAEPGGPDASLDWAEAQLAARGRAPVTAVRQLRTWNLSSIWVLRTARDQVWLKQVPSFFAHEPVVLRWVAEAAAVPLVPRVVAAGESGRMLLDDVPGADLYGTGPATAMAVAERFHPVQVASADAVDELVAAGVPDLRSLAPGLHDLVLRHGGGDARLARLMATLDERLRAVAACGLPDTLVHGDLHPGNARADPRDSAGDNLFILDWGDSFVGHPAFDIIRLAEGMDPYPDQALLVERWAARWRASRPGSDPTLAYRLLLPVAALRNAAVYAGFLDRIEPAEHPYHAQDVGRWLTVAAELAA